MSEPTNNSWETFKAWAESFGFVPVDPDEDGDEGETEFWVIARQAGDEEEPPRAG